MLSEYKTFTSFSAKNMEEIKEFYTNKLGIEIILDMSGSGYMFRSGGNTKFFVYVKDNHVPAEHTVLNFEVENISRTVSDLNSKGIEMENYSDMETDDKGISDQDGMSIAWFKDPAGNIISLIENQSSS